MVFWLVRLFETVFQSISNRLQKGDGERRGIDSTDETIQTQTRVLLLYIYQDVGGIRLQKYLTYDF